MRYEYGLGPPGPLLSYTRLGVVKITPLGLIQGLIGALPGMGPHAGWGLITMHVDNDLQIGHRIVGFRLTTNECSSNLAGDDS